nr:unnamed protein product [Callosobruchus analis]
MQNIYDNNTHRYGTFNTIRSAIALISDNSLGTNPLIKRFLKGLFRLRPSQAKYGVTWDPQIVLNYIEALSKPLSLQRLSQKLATLLALITGGRLQTISLVRVNNIIESDREIQIPITDRIKTSGPNNPQPVLHKPFYHSKPDLCVASTLKECISATAHLRKTPNDFLFLCWKKPNRTASTTLSSSNHILPDTLRLPRLLDRVSPLKPQILFLTKFGLTDDELKGYHR